MKSQIKLKLLVVKFFLLTLLFSILVICVQAFMSQSVLINYTGRITSPGDLNLSSLRGVCRSGPEYAWDATNSWAAPDQSNWSEETFRSAAQDLGANVMNIYLSHEGLTGFSGGTTLQPEHMVYIDNAVNWCGKYGMKVILEYHTAPSGFGFNKDFFSNQAIFDRMASVISALVDRYKDNEIVIGYGPCNEPKWSPTDTEWGSLYVQRMTEITDVIHSIDPDAFVFIQGLGGNDFRLLTPFVARSKVVVAYHHYYDVDLYFNDPYAVTYAEGRFEEAYQLMKQRCYDQFFFLKADGYPVFCNEWSIVDDMYTGELITEATADPSKAVYPDPNGWQVMGDILKMMREEGVGHTFYYWYPRGAWGLLTPPQGWNQPREPKYGILKADLSA